MQRSLQTHQSAQIIEGTVPEPPREQDYGSTVNQTLQNNAPPLEQKLAENIADSQENIQTLENTVKQLEHKLATIDDAAQIDTQSSKNTIAQLEQKMAGQIADSQEKIQTLENTVKQLEQKLVDKIAASQTDTRSAENTTARLEQKLTDKLSDSQEKIQTLENTVKQLEQKLADKIAASQTVTRSAENTIAQPNTPQNISKVRKPENTEKSFDLVLFEISFQSGGYAINDTTTKLIQQSALYIRSLPPNYRVIVEGHTDNSPLKTIPGTQYPYKDNMGLSLFRAETVADMLGEEGIASTRISAIGYGATRPIATNKTGEGRAKNRRVVVRLITE
jgi:flagellar motor protein MotB